MQGIMKWNIRDESFSKAVIFRTFIFWNVRSYRRNVASNSAAGSVWEFGLAYYES
jgi:hypothetical protein